MNGLIRSVFGIFCAVCLMASCATVDKTEIQQVKAPPQVSKTVAAEMSESGGKTRLKRKVAIARFSNETKYGQSFFLDENNDRIGKQAVDILSARLMETEKFILMERADLDKITKELDMGDYAPLRNMADYLIVGSVTEFGRKNQGKVGIFSRTKRQVAFAKVHIRLIEVRSGKIIYSEEGQGEASTESGSVFGVGERAGYDSSINDKALDAAITNLSSNIIENLLDRPWRAYILGAEEGMIIISGGVSQNINEGDMFTVFKEGKTVKNPQTNMMITLPGKAVGRIRTVYSAGDTPDAEVTFCEVVEGDIHDYIQANDFSSLYIQEK